MTVDILLTLLNVIWGLLLTGIGIEMVNNPPTTARKKWIYRTAFLLLGCAVIATTFSQSVGTASEQESARIQAEKTEHDLSDKVSRSAGKLDAIAQFEQQFLTFVSQQRSGTTSNSDTATKAMALAVMKMAQGSPPAAVSDAPSSNPLRGL